MTERSPAVPPRLDGVDPGDIARRAAIAIDRPLHRLTQLTGGTSGLVYSAVTDARVPVVVKVTPADPAPIGTRRIGREARVLTALAGVPGVAVPKVLGSDAGAPPEMPPLFVMSFADGGSYEPRRIALEAPPTSGEVPARAAAAARMLAALHTVGPAELGIDDEPAVTLGAEVRRWQRVFASCELEPAAELEEIKCRNRLIATMPLPLPPTLRHGDWRLGNMRCIGPAIRAVIGWRSWSVGDPRLDLAWLRSMSDPAHPAAVAPTAPLLEPDELLAAYEAASATAVADLNWFDAVVRYRQAAATALLVADIEPGGRMTDQRERMCNGIPTLLKAARTYLKPATPARDSGWTTGSEPSSRIETGKSILFI